MVKIGLLGVSDEYSNEDWYINNFSYKNVKDTIFDEFKQIELNKKEEIFNFIGEYLKPDEQSMMNITDLLYDENYVFQSIYKSSEDTTRKDYNGLGSQLTRSHKVCGPMILIKRKIGDKSSAYDSFTFDDLHRIVKSTFVHNAIVIHSDSSMEDFPFINDVLESTPDKQTFETIRYHEYKFLDYTMMFYCDISAEQVDTNLNIIASTIYRKKIYGRVFVTLIDNNDENPQFLDLSINTIKQIYHLHRIEQELDHTKYAKKFDLNNTDDFPQINFDPNFFSIIDSEYKKKKNIENKTNPFTFNETLNNIK
jgi:hypothetical protein